LKKLIIVFWISLSSFGFSFDPVTIGLSIWNWASNTAKTTKNTIGQAISISDSISGLGSLFGVKIDGLADETKKLRTDYNRINGDIHKGLGKVNEQIAKGNLAWNSAVDLGKQVDTLLIDLGFMDEKEAAAYNNTLEQYAPEFITMLAKARAGTLKEEDLNIQYNFISNANFAALMTKYPVYEKGNTNGGKADIIKDWVGIVRNLDSIQAIIKPKIGQSIFKKLSDRISVLESEGKQGDKEYLGIYNELQKNKDNVKLYREAMIRLVKDIRSIRTIIVQKQRELLGIATGDIAKKVSDKDIHSVVNTIKGIYKKNNSTYRLAILDAEKELTNKFIDYKNGNVDLTKFKSVNRVVRVGDTRTAGQIFSQMHDEELANFLLQIGYQ
jgi:hypothetical protein